jgi:putative ABC transport system permease protein
MALGAQPSAVLRMIAGHGLRLTLIGAAIGCTGALVLTRFLRSLLYGTAPTDPWTFLVVILLLVFVALLASLIPALRATRVSPMTALRSE